MDEDITIINSNTRNEKIKNFFLNNKRLLISIIVTFILILLSFYSFKIYKSGEREKISNKYNSAVIDYSNGNKSNTQLLMKDVINKKDKTYSPLALYFLLDNKLIENHNEANKLFDIIIYKTSLEYEIKNLIIYKKGLYNAENAEENVLLEILSPLINSESIWKSHALYLVAEYFYSKNENQKSKEFFSKILEVENANQDLIKKTKIRLNRDLGD